MHAPAGAADQQRNVRLQGHRVATVFGELVMLAGVRDGLAVEKSAQQDGSFFEPLHPRSWCVEREAYLRVLRLGVAGAEAQLESPVAQQVQRRRGPCQERRMIEVTVEDHDAESQPVADPGRDREGDERRQTVTEMVRCDDHVEAAIVDAADQLDPCLPRLCLDRLEAEAEGSSCSGRDCHRAMLPRISPGGRTPTPSPP